MALAEGQYAVVQIYAAGGPSKRTVMTDQHVLTKEDVIKHKGEVEAGILEELLIWAGYLAFRRDKR